MEDEEWEPEPEGENLSVCSSAALRLFIAVTKPDLKLKKWSPLLHTLGSELELPGKTSPSAVWARLICLSFLNFADSSGATSRLVVPRRLTRQMRRMLAWRIQPMTGFLCLTDS